MPRQRGNVWTCVCGARNEGDRLCERCGLGRGAKRVPDEAMEKASHCLCGSPLTFEGKCQSTGDWPRIAQDLTSGKYKSGEHYLTVACPFVCPSCRSKLTWEGACFTCHGTTTGNREDWTMPGDYYEREGVHWVLAEKGPRPACGAAEYRERFREVMAVLVSAPVLQPIPRVIGDTILADARALPVATDEDW